MSRVGPPEETSVYGFYTLIRGDKNWMWYSSLKDAEEELKSCDLDYAVVYKLTPVSQLKTKRWIEPLAADSQQA